MQASGALYTIEVKTKGLLACGAVAGPLFTIAWILSGATRANYDSLHHPISSLAIGWLWLTVLAIYILKAPTLRRLSPPDL